MDMDMDMENLFGFAIFLSFAENTYRNCEWEKRKLAFKKPKNDFLMRQEKIMRAVDGKQLFSFRWPNENWKMKKYRINFWKWATNKQLF